MDEPLISIIIPTYNGSVSILDAVQTAGRQTWSNKEIIIVVDGSTDDTAEKLNRYKLGLPKAKRDRLKIIVQENSGVSAARNKGMTYAQGDYFALLDDDDRWHPRKLGYQIKHLRHQEGKTPNYPILCMTDYRAIDRITGESEIRKCRGSSKVEVAVIQGFPPPSTWVFSRRTAETIAEPVAGSGEFRLFDIALCAGEDYDVLIRLCKAGAILSNVNRPLTSYFVPVEGKAYGNHDRADPAQERQNRSAARQLDKHGAWMKEQYPAPLYQKMIAWYKNRVPSAQFSAIMESIDKPSMPARTPAMDALAALRVASQKKL